MKEKILRIRPFNMANFSGGSGYMPMTAMLGAFTSLPATFLLWTGMVLPMKTKDGKLDYEILKRRLNRFALPICIVMFVLFTWANVANIYGDIWAYMPASLWAAVFPTLGIYLSMILSAKRLVSGNNLTRGKFLLSAMILMGLMAVIGWFVLTTVFIF